MSQESLLALREAYMVQGINQPFARQAPHPMYYLSGPNNSVLLIILPSLSHIVFPDYIKEKKKTQKMTFFLHEAKTVYNSLRYFSCY